jgi:hypothetical protein
MTSYLDTRPLNSARLTPIALAKRYMLTLMLAAVLAAVEVERPPVYTQPDPIVMILPPVGRPRLERARPYRAHYRRGGR